MTEPDTTPARADDGATRIRPLPPKAAIRGVSGAYFGKTKVLIGRVTIGRDADCDLVLDEPEISRKHAVIEATPGGLVLRDLGSVNGTFVNGAWVREAQLKIGDQIGFDRDRFLIEAWTPAGAANPGNRVPETPPPEPESSPSAMPWIIGLVAVAVIVGLVWYLMR